MAGLEKRHTWRDLERPDAADNNQPNVPAGFPYGFDLALRYSEDLVGIVFRRSVGADDGIRPRNDAGDLVYIAEVVLDGFCFDGQARGIARYGRDVMPARKQFGDDAASGFSGCAVDNYVHGSLPLEELQVNWM